jgi:hypothetical protein
MVMATFTKKRIAVATAALVVLGAGGIAYAYWTAGGSGTGTASTGTTTGLTVNQDALATPLAPGIPAQTLSGDFDNPNAGPVYVTSVTAAISSVTDIAGDPITGCDATDYTLASATMPVGHQIAIGDGVDSWSGATLAFNNKATNQDACKNAVVHLGYTVS